MKTKMLRRIISVICAVGMSASCATGFVSAADTKVSGKASNKKLTFEEEEEKRLKDALETRRKCRQQLDECLRVGGIKKHLTDVEVKEKAAAEKAAAEKAAAEKAAAEKSKKLGAHTNLMNKLQKGSKEDKKLAAKLVIMKVGSRIEKKIQQEKQDNLVRIKRKRLDEFCDQVEKRKKREEQIEKDRKKRLEKYKADLRKIEAKKDKIRRAQEEKRAIAQERLEQAQYKLMYDLSKAGKEEKNFMINYRIEEARQKAYKAVAEVHAKWMSEQKKNADREARAVKAKAEIKNYLADQRKKREEKKAAIEKHDDDWYFEMALRK